MLSSFTGVLSRLKEASIVQKVSQKYQNIRDQIIKKMEIVEVIPKLYHITYPQTGNIKDLKSHIGQSDYQIWNIGQYKYQKELQDKMLDKNQKGEIHHLCFQYYSNLPLYQLIIAINSIQYFLQISENNKVYLHCQDNKLRSSVFLACFIFHCKIKKIYDLSQAILFVNQKLSTQLEVEQTESETSNYKNQHIFFKNFINYENSPQIINKHKLQLLKIIVSDAPRLKILNEVIGKGDSIKELKVFIQIRQKQNVVLKATYDNAVFEGDSMCIVLANRTIIIGDDFLVMIKYVYKGKVYGMMRIQLNTNFIFEKFFRAHQQFIDLSSFCAVQKQSTMFIDFLFQQHLSHSDLAQLQNIPKEKTLTLPKKIQKQKEKQKEKKELETKESEDLKVEAFSLNQHEQEEEHEVDETEINRKIEEVMKSIQNKQTEGEEQSEGKEEEEEQEQDDDLDDYLSKLEQNA